MNPAPRDPDRRPVRPSQIVVGYDGSAASRAAVDLALALAAPTRRHVVAVQADDRRTPPGAPDGVGGAQPEAPAGVAEYRVLPGPGAAVLCTVAERERAEMIVVGSTHRGILGRIAPGSLAEQLLQGAPCAVAVAPLDRPASKIRTVSVAWDRRPEAAAALTCACRLAEQHGASVRLLCACYAPGPSQESEDPDEQSAFRARLQAEVRSQAAALPSQLRATSELLLGNPGPALVAACGDDTDLLVAGSRSYGPLRGALTGSVSRYLVDHAPCPVLVVPRGRAASVVPPVAARGSAVGG